MSTLKLTFSGMTKRAIFPDAHPSWNDLSQRVESLFDVPAAAVALSYVDPDGDIMFISSNDELFDFFHTEPSQPHNTPPVHRFTVHDMRQSRSPGDDFEHVPPGAQPDDVQSSSSSSSDSSADVEIPNLGNRRPSRSMGAGGMGIGFAPFEMMFGPAASAANVKSPSQGHISPVPSEFAALAAENGMARGGFARSVSASSARSQSTVGDTPGNPTIHIQQPSNDSMSEVEPVTPAAPMHPIHPTPALYHDVANFVHALSGALDAHPEVSNTLRYLLANASSGAYWNAIPPPVDAHQASAHDLLGAVDSLLRTFFPPPPPSTPTPTIPTMPTPAYTAANFELPASVAGDQTPIPSRLHTPAQPPIPLTASPAMTATSIPSTVQGPAIRPVLDMARADRSSVRSDTDAGSIVSGMGSPLRGTGPAWRFAGRTGGGAPASAATTGVARSFYPPHPALNVQTGAIVPVPAGQPETPEAAKYVESRVRLEHMKEMYKQTKEEYRREREERKREREQKKRERLIGPPEPVVAPAPQGDMFDRLNEALHDVPGRVGMRPESGRTGIIPPAAPSVAGSVITNETAVRNRNQMNVWLIKQLEDMGFSASTHPQVSQLVRTATRPYATNTEGADENALLEGLLAQLVPTSSKV